MSFKYTCVELLQTHMTGNNVRKISQVYTYIYIPVYVKVESSVPNTNIIIFTMPTEPE